MTRCYRPPELDPTDVHRRVRALRILCIAALFVTAAIAAIANS